MDLKDLYIILFDIKSQVNQKLQHVFSEENKLIIKEKDDLTIVTEVDLFISNLFKAKLSHKFPNLHFLSEEETDIEHLKYPIAILDPIDGTREFSKQIEECVISFGVYYSSDLDDERSFSWLYNPFTGFEISSNDIFYEGKRLYNPQLLSYVSRTEFEKELYQNSSEAIYLPKGSIAYKLGLLAAGACNYVVSKKPKNIWDIMAGTHICHTRGINLYQNKSYLPSLNEILIKNNLIWCREEISQRIFNIEK